MLSKIFDFVSLEDLRELSRELMKVVYRVMTSENVSVMINDYKANDNMFLLDMILRNIFNDYLERYKKYDGGIKNE